MPNRLISLEMQGYKTFASKTEFKFPAQLTAIVGPNGSGKSNIADSVRWVLGEQAYSLLRGKKTVDMIFSGSEQRSRASMASVSITFDNSNGWLPVDFNEVNITRRAYRNGENEYLINNQKVRLKEINELLASSGLAERNYTIIGQGLVDSALSLRPEDRRSFFEEAAGIGLYRSRRSEANQKLEKTLHNVERIRDILAELKPRIRSLEKQQEKSISYNQIDADLKLLLKDWYGYHWHRTQENLSEAIRVNAAQQEKVNDTRTERKGFEVKLELAQKTLADKRFRLSELHGLLSALHVEKEENTRQIAVLEEREKAQKDRLAEINQNFEMNLDRHESLRSEIVELRKVYESNEQELTRIESDMQDAQSKLDERLTRRNEIETQILQIEVEVNKFTQEILRLRTLIEGLSKQVTMRESEQAHLKVRIQKSEESYKVEAQKLQELEDEHKSLSGVLSKKTADRKLIGEELIEITAEQNLQQENKQKCDNLLSKLNAQHKLLEEAEQALSGFTSGAKSVIDASRSGVLRGKFHLLVDHLDVPEEYEVAVASALGAIMEGILVDSEEDILRVIDFVNQSKTARTILIENRPSVGKSSIPVMKGSLVNAADVISANNAEHSVIREMLSAVFIAEDVRDARSAISQLEPGSRIVTKNGEVFSADGTITVGKETRTKTFERKREKTSLEEEILTTRDTAQEIQNGLKVLAERLAEKQNTARNVQSDVQQIEAESSKVELAIHKANIEQTQRQVQIDEEKIRLANLESGLEKESSDIVALREKIISLESEINEKENAVSKLYEELKVLPVEELRGIVMDMHSKLAVARQMVETNSSRLSEKDALLQNFQRNKDEDEGRIKELKNALVEIASQLTETKTKDEIVSEKIYDLGKETKPLEKQVESEITAQSAFLEEVDTARQKFAIAERHKMQAQLKVDKLRERLERYQQQIGEDFGIFVGEEDSAFGPKPLPIEGIVSQLPVLEDLPEGISDQIGQKKSLLRRLGPVNPNAEQEYKEVSERFHFLSEQLLDLDKAEQDLRKIVGELDQMMRTEFMKTFKKVAVEFESIFTQLFNGGTAKLVVENEENILESGIDIEATLPGRRKQELALLSGGERSLTAVALIFALLRISPTPFCILDEVDAMLDESNVMRFGDLLKELSDSTQFIIITHNRNTVQLADIIYGVTMGKDSVSQIISLKLDELTDEMVH